MRRLKEDKEGQALTLTTIIIIVLGIAVLVFLIWGFSVGWGNFWDRITAYTGGTNADAIKSGCELACSGSQITSYCADVKTLKIGDETLKGSCKNFESKLGISCSIDCGDKEYKQTCGDLGGEWKKDCGEGVTLLAPVNKKDMPKDKTNCCKK